MKKIFLTLVLFLSFALTFGAEEVTLNGCGANALAISSSCCSGCVSVVPALTGSLDVDINSGL